MERQVVLRGLGLFCALGMTVGLEGNDGAISKSSLLECLQAQQRVEISRLEELKALQRRGVLVVSEEFFEEQKNNGRLGQYMQAQQRDGFLIVCAKYLQVQLNDNDEILLGYIEKLQQSKTLVISTERLERLERYAQAQVVAEMPRIAQALQEAFTEHRVYLIRENPAQNDNMVHQLFFNIAKNFREKISDVFTADGLVHEISMLIGFADVEYRPQDLCFCSTARGILSIQKFKLSDEYDKRYLRMSRGFSGLGIKVSPLGALVGLMQCIRDKISFPCIIRLDKRSKEKIKMYLTVFAYEKLPELLQTLTGKPANNFYGYDDFIKEYKKLMGYLVEAIGAEPVVELATA